MPSTQRTDQPPRYVNWVRQTLAEPGQGVRGVIVCRTMSEDLRLACASIRDVRLFEYQLSVSVTKVPTLELPEFNGDVRFYSQAQTLRTQVGTERRGGQ